MEKENFRKINDYLWEIPKNFRSAMRVPARIYADEKMLKTIEPDALTQVVNVATLPGIINYSLAMPDIHTGYGFVIGGVAAMGIKEGVISPGGVGFDINCSERASFSKRSLGKSMVPYNHLCISDYSQIADQCRRVPRCAGLLWLW